MEESKKYLKKMKLCGRWLPDMRVNKAARRIVDFLHDLIMNCTTDASLIIEVIDDFCEVLYSKLRGTDWKYRESSSINKKNRGKTLFQLLNEVEYYACNFMHEVGKEVVNRNTPHLYDEEIYQEWKRIWLDRIEQFQDAKMNENLQSVISDLINALKNDDIKEASELSFCKKFISGVISGSHTFEEDCMENRKITTSVYSLLDSLNFTIGYKLRKERFQNRSKRELYPSVQLIIQEEENERN